MWYIYILEKTQSYKYNHTYKKTQKMLINIQRGILILLIGRIKMLYFMTRSKSWVSLRNWYFYLLGGFELQVIIPNKK